MILHDPGTIARYTGLGLWGQTTLDALFQATVAARPGDEAVADPPNRADFAFGAPRTLSYADLEDHVVALAHRLLAAGLGKDSVIFTHLPNIAETIVVYLAGLRIGAIISPAQMAYGEADLARKAAHVRAAGIVCLERYGERRPAAEFERLRRTVGADAPPLFVLGEGDGAISAFERPDAGQRSRVAAHNASTPVDANEVVGLLWTSGTTGFPKCAPRSHNNALSYAGITVELSFMGPGARILVPLSMAHTSGLTCYFPAWLMTGGLLALHQPFDFALYLEQLETLRINATVAAPAMLTMILKQKALAGRDLSALTAIMSGSAPLDAWIIETFEREYGITIANSFGSTEGIAMGTGPWMSASAEARATLYPRCVASALRPSAAAAGVPPDSATPEQRWSFSIATGVQHRIVDLDTGEALSEERRPGELALQSPTLFAGYLNADFTLDREDFDADGFFRTGEIFEIVAGEAGPDFLHYIDRLKDVINRGGVTIPAGELNAAVQEHPAILEAAVIGMPDPDLGERICVAVVLRPGTTLSLAELKDFVAATGIARFMWPEHLVLVDALPRNPTGKVLKRELRDAVAP